MPVLRGCVVGGISTALTLAIVACGAETTATPTSPTGTASSASRALITGTVMDSTSSAVPSSTLTTQATNRPVTVSVVGTGISSVIDRSGRFQLTGVPPGDAQLRFTATGLDASLMLRGIQAGERIDIKVRLTDTSVRIEAERRDRNDDDDEIKGTVAGLAGACPAISFTLNGVVVRAGSSTRYEDVTCAQMRNTLRVEVHGQRQADGSLAADRIERED